MKTRYDELYNIKRIRHDDCIAKLQDEFYMSKPESVLKALRTADEELMTNQMEMTF